MTFVGKILVIVILAFSLFFLALSTVVFTASTNWRTAHEEIQKKAQETQSSLTSAQQQLEARQQELEQEQGERANLVQAFDAEKARLQQEIADLQRQATDVTEQLEVAQQTAKAAIEEVQAKTQETDVIRERFQAVQVQANDFKRQQTELNEQIRILEQQFAVAQQNNADLREDVAAYRNFLQSRNLPSDPAEVRVASADSVAPADVEGQIARVSVRNDVVEITIGSDDGVVAGQEYAVFRTGDSPQYICKIRIIGTEPDRSVARVFDSYLGRKPKEGDSVAAQIQPRS